MHQLPPLAVLVIPAHESGYVPEAHIGAIQSIVHQAESFPRRNSRHAILRDFHGAIREPFQS